MVTVTCYYTKEKIDKKIAFKIVLDGKVKPNYFKDEATYNKWLDEELAKESIQIDFNYIIGKNKYTAISKQTMNTINMWLKSYSYAEIAFCLNIFKNDILKFRSKGLPYIVKVIENKLIESKDLFINKTRIQSKQVVKDINFETYEMVNNFKYKPNGKDIRKWIEE